MHEQIHFLLNKKLLHFTGHLLHIAITCEQNESAAAGFLDEMRDPTFQLFLISRLARVGHFFHDEHFHLLLEIEGAAELQRLGFGGADPFAEISEIGASHRVEREKLRCLARALDPVDMLRCALLQKNCDPVTRVANPAPEFLEFGF